MADYPLINGLRFDYSSVEINANGSVLRGVKEISYSHKLEPGLVRGTSAQIQGRTRGQYEPEGSMTLYKQEALELIQALGGGYMEKSFDLVVHFSDFGQPLITDRVLGCRIKSEEDSHQEGSDALVTKFDLSVIAVIKGGIDPISNLSL